MWLIGVAPRHLTPMEYYPGHGALDLKATLKAFENSVENILYWSIIDHFDASRGSENYRETTTYLREAWEGSSEFCQRHGG